MAAGNMAFTDNEIAFGETFHKVADAIDHADELVTDGYRDRNRFLCPFIPVVDMNVGSADRRFHNADENIVPCRFRDGNFFEPKPGLGFGFDHGLHRFLHETKLGESGKQESRKRIRGERLSILPAAS
jgi:hypothetical protein